jgi:CheY-like chemotaxis protein
MSEFADERPRVLVVDDNRDAAATLGFLLAGAGYRVETRFGGEPALNAVEEFEPDACVLDIAMPGMDGYELARRLKARRPDRPPVLAAVTGFRDVEHVERAGEAGFDLYFTKPANPTEMAAKLRGCLGL